MLQIRPWFQDLAPKNCTSPTRNHGIFQNLRSSKVTFYWSAQTLGAISVFFRSRPSSPGGNLRQQRSWNITNPKKKWKSLKIIIYWYCLIPPKMGNLMNPDRTVPLWFLQEIQQGIFISLPCPDQQWTTMSETKQEHSMGILLGFSMWDRISWKWHGATLFRVSIDMLWSLFVIKS